MTYEETIEFMYNSLPMYHRIGQAAYKADLSNTEAMMDHLGHPERRLRCVHVAGTNGKGSVSHFLASVLGSGSSHADINPARPLRVGLYTSPHLIDFRERIRIDGDMVPKDYVSRFMERNLDFFKSHQLSFFEMTVGLAFQYFADSQVDIAVVEVGMGGRLDSTNVVRPLLSVITNISFDHTQFLGDTLAKIAGEKAGIIKTRVPVVIGQTQPETQSVFQEKAGELEAPIVFADSHYRIQELPSEEDGDVSSMRFQVMRDGIPEGAPMVSPLAGSYQLKNLATLMQAIEALRLQGWNIPEAAVSQGIANVVRGTGLHGRWEQFGTNPALVCETAHNEDGIREMMAKLGRLSYRRLHIVYGCVGDKDFRHILRHFKTVPPPKNAADSVDTVVPNYYYTQPSVPRRLDVDTLSQAARDEGMEGPAYATVGEAIEAARAKAAPDDFILVTGSIYLVADAVDYLQGKE